MLKNNNKKIKKIKNKNRRKIWLNWHRIYLFVGKGANKRCADSCTWSDGATDDDDDGSDLIKQTDPIFCTASPIEDPKTAQERDTNMLRLSQDYQE